MHSSIPVVAAVAAAIALAAAPAAQAQPGSGSPEARPLQRVGAPAVFDGLWCGTGLLHEFSLRLSQQQHDVQGTLMRRDRVREIEGRADGGTLRTQATKVGSLVLERAGDELRITGGDGPLALARGATFLRTAGAACSG